MIDTLRSICEQCVHLQRPQLEFLPAGLERQKQILSRDLRELVSAASLELDKTVVVLTGSLFESVLYSFIQAQSAYIAARRGSFTFNPDHALGNYVNIFNKWFSDVHTIPDIVIGYRDMVHINRELAESVDTCQRAARDMLRLLDALLGTLAETFGK